MPRNASGTGEKNENLFYFGDLVVHPAFALAGAGPLSAVRRPAERAGSQANDSKLAVPHHRAAGAVQTVLMGSRICPASTVSTILHQ
jgi:hypothetical protein